MLKSLPVALTHQNIKCGGVFYVDQKTYHVSCIVCSEKILYQLFPKHFRTEHLEKGLNINLLDTCEVKIDGNAVNLAVIKQEDEDPIASETTAYVGVGQLLHKINQLDQEIIEEDRTYTKTKSETQEFDMAPQTTEIFSEYDQTGLENDIDHKHLEESSESCLDQTISDDEHDFNKDFSLFECPICNRRFESALKMNTHRRGHDRKKKMHKKDKTIMLEYKCDQCDKVFRNEREQEAHKYTHTGIFCDVCGMKFSQVGNLRRHKLRHTGVKSFKCDDCGKSFFTVKELDCHKVWHTGQFRYICEICAKPCVHKANLKQHMRRHTGERPFKCDHCGKCFFTRHDLNVHSVGHSDERPFVCDICGSTFRLKKALRVHKKIHVKERPFICEICSKGFIVEAGLKAHMRCHDGTLTKIAQITAPKTTIQLEENIQHNR